MTAYFMGKLVFIFFFLCCFPFVDGKTQGEVDSNYIQVEPEVLVTRLYLSRKYTDLRFPDKGIRYQPNSGLNMGIGFTYQNFTLNLAFPPGFLNRSRESDFPRFLDLQGHIYPRNWVIDFFGQFYNGYRILSGIGKEQGYLRPDLDLLKVGVHANYIFKGDKISLPAAVHQSAIQKKSALSPVVGFEVYRVQVAGDSLVFPTQLAPRQNYQSADFLQLGPNAGLIGTLVFGKGFFATGSFTGNLALGSTWNSGITGRNWNLSLGTHARAYVGYNGPRFGVNVNYVYKTLALQPVENWTQEVQTGNYRFVLVYKIRPSKTFASTFSRYSPTRILRKSD